MSADDYAQYIIQKHQLAIALAIIKSKPADITYEAYINIVKNKINERNMDSNVDITICDDDFNISDDFTQYDDQMINGDDQMINGDDQMINGDVQMTVGDDLNNSHDSVNILKNFELADLDDPCKQNSDLNSLLDVMTELSNIEDNSEIVVNNPQYNFNKSTNFEETQIPLNLICNKSYGINDNVRNFCHTYVPSNDKVDNNHITGDNNSTNHTIYNNNSIPNHAINLNENLSNITYCESNNYTDGNKDNDNNNLIIHNNIMFKNRTNKINIENNKIDSQQTILYTLQGFTNNTHVSQSQEETSVIVNKHLLNISKTVLNDNPSIQNISENSQKKKDKLIDTNLSNKTKNRYSEEDFENFYANKIGTLDKNTNETENIYSSQDCQHFDVNKANVLDNTTIFSNDDGQRKHKNVECDCHYNSKRAKIDGKENNSQDSSTRLKPTEFSQNPYNTTKSLEIPFDLNRGHDLAIFSQNNEIDFVKTFNRNTEQAKINTKKDYLTQDFEFLDSYSNIPDTSQSKLNFNGDRGDNLTPDSQSLLLPNTHGNTSFKTAFNFIVKENTNNNNDSNITTEDVIEKKNTQNLKNMCSENFINVDEPFINLSQNVRNVGNYKMKEIIFESKRKEFVSNNDETDPEELLKESSNKNIETQENISNLKTNQQLRQIIPNNLANDETNEVILHQKKMKECISQDSTQIDILTQNDASDNEIDSQSEIVPFKVLEDLNKIKCYLNRSEKRFSQGFNSLDSGFKSSQPRSSYKSASQYSEVCKNESAHCLLSFVTVNQLSDKTAVIAEEISRILGQLVDKLHEEEKYPNFLEELLEKVAMLLNDVYEGNNGESNALLKRDDDIYRVILLNRSAHIIKYTIEKITTILEKTLSDLKEDIFELKHIDKTENLCYIFHILEVILKRYKKTNVSSQMSVQNSQDDDRLLKKSSLTDIWRKKWNLAKSENIEGSSKKTCVLTKCSQVLNKIIVKAMDGYSLVSFAALQCFNLLQN